MCGGEDAVLTEVEIVSGLIPSFSLYGDLAGEVGDGDERCEVVGYVEVALVVGSMSFRGVGRGAMQELLIGEPIEMDSHVRDPDGLAGGHPFGVVAGDDGPKDFIDHSTPDVDVDALRGGGDWDECKLCVRPDE